MVDRDIQRAHYCVAMPGDFQEDVIWVISKLNKRGVIK